MDIEHEVFNFEYSNARLFSLFNYLLKFMQDFLSMRTASFLLTATFLLLTSCVATPQDIARDRQSRSNLDQDPAISLKTVAVGEFTLHYSETGEVGDPVIVFIHGTPGSWRSLGRMMTRTELQNAARMISIDRPGWGDSIIQGQRSEPDFEKQSELIVPLLAKLKQEAPDQPLILAGHSYGGSISPFLAYKYPEYIDGVLMAASAIDPKLGKPRWYNYAASIWPISRLIDQRLQIANDEIWGVAKALRMMDTWWQTSTLPLIYVQGEDDELVHPGNMDFAEKMFPKNSGRVVRLKNQGHLLHVQRRDLLSELTLEVLEKSKMYLASRKNNPDNRSTDITEATNLCTDSEIC